MSELVNIGSHLSLYNCMRCVDCFCTGWFRCEQVYRSIWEVLWSNDQSVFARLQVSSPTAVVDVISSMSTPVSLDRRRQTHAWCVHLHII